MFEKLMNKKGWGTFVIKEKLRTSCSLLCHSKANYAHILYRRENDHGQMTAYIFS